MHWIYMYQNGLGTPGLGEVGTYAFLGLLPILIWSLAWKGWALWLAARRGETVWFLVLLILNTFGLLEIFYIFLIAKRKDIREESETTSELKGET